MPDAFLFLQLLSHKNAQLLSRETKRSWCWITHMKNPKYPLELYRPDWKSKVPLLESWNFLEKVRSGFFPWRFTGWNQLWMSMTLHSLREGSKKNPACAGEHSRRNTREATRIIATGERFLSLKWKRFRFGTPQKMRTLFGTQQVHFEGDSYYCNRNSDIPFYFA